MLTYRDRASRLREKKLQHTLEKKSQQGYMDADDYGSIPLPKDYAYKPIPNEGKEFFYGPMGNAVNFAEMLRCHPVYVDPLEIMCGRCEEATIRLSIIFSRVMTDNGFRSLRTHFRQFRKTFDFNSPTLIICKMPMKTIHIM